MSESLRRMQLDPNPLKTFKGSVFVRGDGNTIQVHYSEDHPMTNNAIHQTNSLFFKDADGMYSDCFGTRLTKQELTTGEFLIYNRYKHTTPKVCRCDEFLIEDDTLDYLEAVKKDLEIMKLYGAIVEVKQITIEPVVSSMGNVVLRKGGTFNV
jgi:hypothetical protein